MAPCLRFSARNGTSRKFKGTFIGVNARRYR
jgi:hypothetical protein